MENQPSYWKWLYHPFDGLQMWAVEQPDGAPDHDDIDSVNGQLRGWAEVQPSGRSEKAFVTYDDIELDDPAMLGEALDAVKAEIKKAHPEVEDVVDKPRDFKLASAWDSYPPDQAFDRAYWWVRERVQEKLNRIDPEDTKGIQRLFESALMEMFSMGVPMEQANQMLERIRHELAATIGQSDISGEGVDQFERQPEEWTEMPPQLAPQIPNPTDPAGRYRGEDNPWTQPGWQNPEMWFPNKNHPAVMKPIWDYQMRLNSYEPSYPWLSDTDGSVYLGGPGESHHQLADRHKLPQWRWKHQGVLFKGEVVHASPRPPEAVLSLVDKAWSKAHKKDYETRRDRGQFATAALDENGQWSWPQPVQRPIDIIPAECPYCTMNGARGETGCTCGYLRDLELAKAQQDEMRRQAMGQNGPLPEGLHFVTKDGQNLYAYVGDEEVGALSMGWDNEISHIDVTPEWRRLGIATAMFDEADRIWGPISHSMELSEDGSAWVQEHDPDHWQQWSEFQQHHWSAWSDPDTQNDYDDDRFSGWSPPKPKKPPMWKREAPAWSKPVTKKADYQGWSNWETWNTKLMMDNDYELYQQMQKMIERGLTPEQLQQWTMKNVIGPYNRQAIEDAREWNEIPPHDRLDHRWEDLKEKSPEAADIVDGLGMGEDVSDEEPNLIQESLVNWDEIYQSIMDEVNENQRYEQQSQDLENRGITFGQPGRRDEDNFMIDAWMKHHGLTNEEDRYKARMNVPFENLVNGGSEYTYPDNWLTPETRGAIMAAQPHLKPPPFHGNQEPDYTDPNIQHLIEADPRIQELKQNGYDTSIHSVGWNTMHSIKHGKPNPYTDTMQQALLGQGHTPEQVQHIMRPVWRWDEATQKHEPIEGMDQAPQIDPSLDQPGDFTLPDHWSRSRGAVRRVRALVQEAPRSSPERSSSEDRVADIVRRFDEAGKLTGGWSCEGGSAALSQMLDNEGIPHTLQVGLYHWPPDHPTRANREADVGELEPDQWEIEHHHWIETADGRLIDPNGGWRGEPRMQPLVGTGGGKRSGQSGMYEPREDYKAMGDSPLWIRPSDEAWEGGEDGEMMSPAEYTPYSGELPAWQALGLRTADNTPAVDGTADDPMIARPDHTQPEMRQAPAPLLDTKIPVGYDPTHTYWAYLNGRVAYGPTIHAAMRQVAAGSLDSHTVNRLSNLLAAGAYPHSLPHDIAAGMLVNGRPRILVSNADRNAVYDAVVAQEPPDKLVAPKEPGWRSYLHTGALSEQWDKPQRIREWARMHLGMEHDHIEKLIADHGRVLPYSQLPPEAQKSMAHYMAVDGEAWEPRNTLEEYVAEHGHEPYGYAEIPADKLKATILGTYHAYPTWDDWLRADGNQAGGQEGRGVPPESNEIWPVILDRDYEGVLQDGWHRLHDYTQRGIDPIPAVYYTTTAGEYGYDQSPSRS